jgi:hypothetical protein
MTETGLKAQDWLTESLVRELESHYPADNDKEEGGARNIESMTKHLREMFLIGRKFASFKHIGQLIEKLAGPWGFVVTHSSGKFVCSYGLDSGKKYRRVESSDRQRERESL